MHFFKVDLIPELPVLQLVQTQGNIEEKLIIHEIHQLAGISGEYYDIEKKCKSQTNYFENGLQRMYFNVFFMINGKCGCSMQVFCGQVLYFIFSVNTQLPM